VQSPMSNGYINRYLDSLHDGRRVYVAGKLIEDVRSIPAFLPILGTISSIIGDQGQSWTRAADPEFALHPPCARQDLEERYHATLEMAERTHGLIGRWNDYMFSYLLDFVTLRALTGSADPEAPKRLLDYADFCRRTNPVLSHAVSHPQVDRRKSPQENGALRIEEVRQDSIVVTGARMVATMVPLAHELLITPFGVYPMEHEDLVLFFSVPVNTAGISLHVRPLEATPHDPLDAFDEPDAMVCFEHVKVPKERVFLAGSSEVANKFFPHATPLSYFTSLCRMIARLEFIAGIARAVLHAIGAGEFPHNKMAIGDAAAEILAIRGLVRGAIDEAETDPVRGCMVPKIQYVWAGLLKGSVAARNISRIITEQAGAGVLMRLDPGAVDDSLEQMKLEPVCRGELLTGRAKASILRLAWSIALGPVGARQFLYDHYAFGDPFSLRSYLGSRYDWKPGFNQVQAIIESIREE
jgi:4-hydroxyphenylacetate 3-monooxygenase